MLWGRKRQERAAAIVCQLPESSDSGSLWLSPSPPLLPHSRRAPEQLSAAGASLAAKCSEFRFAGRVTHAYRVASQALSLHPLSQLFLSASG